MRLRDAPDLNLTLDGCLPGGNEVDCNSPSWWRNGTLYMVGSCAQPFIGSSASALVDFKGNGMGVRNFNISSPSPIGTPAVPHFGGVWIESAFVDEEDGLIFGYYHNEPGNLCPGRSITAPRIGAAVSSDNGGSWADLGWVLLAPNGTLNCSANQVAGGNGDHEAFVDRDRKYIYFYFGAYAGRPAEQGVGAARLAYHDRHAPSGKVMKWYRFRNTTISFLRCFTD